MVIDELKAVYEQKLRNPITPGVVFLAGQGGASGGNDDGGVSCWKDKCATRGGLGEGGVSWKDEGAI